MLASPLRIMKRKANPYTKNLKTYQASFLVYNLIAISKRTTYIGYTNNLKKRFLQHNQILKHNTKFTKKSKWNINFFIIGFKSKNTAMSFESRIKKKKYSFEKHFILEQAHLLRALNFLNELKDNHDYHNLTIYVNEENFDVLPADFQNYLPDNSNISLEFV